MRGIRVRDPSTGVVMFEIVGNLTKILGRTEVNSSRVLSVPEYALPGIRPVIACTPLSNQIDNALVPAVYADAGNGGRLVIDYLDSGYPASVLRMPVNITFGVF